MNYVISDKTDLSEIIVKINDLPDRNSFNVECLNDDNIPKQLSDLALVVEDDTFMLIEIIKRLGSNSSIKNVIGTNNKITFFKVLSEIESIPIFVSIDFQLLGEKENIYNYSSEIYLQVKNLFPTTPVIGYTNYESSGDERSPETKQLIELYRSKGDSVFDKGSINTPSAYNNIVRDKIRIAKILAEYQNLANDYEQLKTKSSKMKKSTISGIQAKEEAYIKCGEDNPLFQEIPLIGKSEAMMRIKFCIEEQANIDNDRSLLLLGETGTGKEMVALALHRLSKKRCNNEFVSVNCGRNVGDLFESAYFGHEKGSFTGAEKSKIGFIEEANGGVLFLDEIAELSLENQTKLLKTIEDKKIRRVGGSKDIKIDFKLIAATKEDLLERVRMGLFREDLYFRIRSSFPKIPNLEERKEDIPLLINHFIEETEKQFSPEAIVFMSTKLNYKGNIRDLKQIIQDVSDQSPEQIIQVDDIEYVMKNIPGINYKKEEENNYSSNPKVQYTLDEIYRIVNDNLVNKSITETFIAQEFKGITGKNEISRNTFLNDYWYPNKVDIIKLIENDKDKYLSVIKLCGFIRKEL